MASVSKVSTISKVFSKLGDNTGSVIPMYAKDVTSDALTCYTYFKEGGNHDGAEKVLEEFGTGVIWLGGIPWLKKHLFDNLVYKKAKINPEVDAKRLFSGNDKNIADTVEFAKSKAESLGTAFKEQAEILGDTIKNKGLAKKLALTKFGVSTALTGLALCGLITLKQKRTEKMVEKQVREKYAKEAYLKNELEESTVYQTFGKNKQNSNNPSFKGLANIGTFFMTNPVANTTLVDAVITGTRLAQAREGERFEVGLKEACQLLFIYGLAKPMQDGMEFLSEKVLKKPIGLDYSVLDSDVLKSAIEAEKENKGSSSLMHQARKIVELAGNDKKTTNENAKKVIDFLFDNQNGEMADVFKKTGDIGIYKTKEGIEQLSLLGRIDVNKLKGTAQKTIDTIESAVKNSDTTKYLKNTKFIKGTAIVANIGISALLLGYLQPKLNIALRKKFNNGDNTNPAIRNLTNEMEQKLAFK